MYVIVRDDRVIWRGNVRSTCVRLAPFFRGIPGVEMFGTFSPFDTPTQEVTPMLHPTLPDTLDVITHEFDEAEADRLTVAELHEMGVRAFNVLTDEVDDLREHGVHIHGFDLRRVETVTNNVLATVYERDDV